MNHFGHYPSRPVLLAVILLTIGLVYSPILGNHFTNWDDQTILSENRDIQGLNVENLKAIFTKNYVGTYIPLTLLSFSLEYAVFGHNEFMYYFDNLCLFLLFIGLMYHLAEGLGLSILASSLAVLLFGLHPMHVESVAWISQRKDLLCSVFFVLSLGQYVSYIKSGKFSAYGLSLIFGFLSILAKPMAYSLPLILLLFDWFTARTLTWKLFVEKCPFILSLGSVSWLTYTANDHQMSMSAVTAILVWVWVFVFHLEKFFWPYPLIPAYEVPIPIALSTIEYVWALTGLAGLGCLAVWFRRNKWFWFAMMFYLWTDAMIIVRSAWEFGNNSVVADRFMFLPSLGLCMALGVALASGVRHSCQSSWGIRLLTAMGAMVFFLLAATSYVQVHIWENSVTLWTHVLKFQPNRVLAYKNRAAGYSAQGKNDLALDDLDRAILMAPQHANLYFCRSESFRQSGKTQQQLRDLETSEKYDPGDANIYYAKGLVYQNMKNHERAIGQYTMAIERDPNLDRAYYNRGIIYDETGKTDLALLDYAEVIRINPRHEKVFNNRAVVYIQSGQLDKALSDLERARRVDPNNSRVYGNLGTVAFMKREYVRAIEFFNKALKLDPRFTDALVNRAVSLALSGRTDQALRDLDRAIAMDQNNANAYYNRAFLKYNLGVLDQSIGDLRQALRLEPGMAKAQELFIKLDQLAKPAKILQPDLSK